MDIKVLTVKLNPYENKVDIDREVRTNFEYVEHNNSYVKDNGPWSTHVYKKEKIALAFHSMAGKIAIYAYEEEKSQEEIKEIVENMVDLLKKDLVLERDRYMEEWNRKYSKLEEFKFNGDVDKF